MDVKNNAFADLAIPETKGRRASFVYLKIVFVPVLIYVVALLGYFKKINFDIGLHTVIMMGVILVVALIFAKHSAELACCYFEQSGADFKRSLKEYIIKHLLVIGKDTKSNASFDDFVAYYTRNLRNENFASVGAGIFPMLGILGTFISIAISMPEFNSSNTVGLEKEISILLSGVATAFYVSIYGIFLALWWIFFERYGMSKFETLVRRQKNATSDFFWSKEEIDKRYLQQSLTHFEKIGVIFEHVSNQEFFTELDRAINKKFQIFTDILKAEENAVKLSSESVKQTMNTLLKTTKEQRDLVKIHSEILNVINQFNRNIKDMQIKFSEQYNRLYEVGGDQISRLERSVSEIQSGVMSFNNSLHIFSNEILEKQKQAMDGFKDSLIDGVQAFKTAFDDEASLAYEDNSTLISELRKDIMKLDEEASEILESIEKTSILDEDRR
ncbi:MotA/TolQ/ExbB proton channel family protein [Campylobacter sp. CCUG 57310]|uniref:MotA/TolQ/ExbB proton channel family protein n=1 Tax=Campylobacter TaxID=194 RepID=UPI001566BC2D|nr:MotA/TolQ/ExbB proton channel family protein [Campylobacter sp. CCUG 57310]QKF92425.1 putative membrane protein [Campylobacter sp. CCUG 57310]